MSGGKYGVSGAYMSRRLGNHKDGGSERDSMTLIRQNPETVY